MSVVPVTPTIGVTTLEVAMSSKQDRDHLVVVPLGNGRVGFDYLEDRDTAMVYLNAEEGQDAILDYVLYSPAAPAEDPDVIGMDREVLLHCFGGVLETDEMRANFKQWTAVALTNIVGEDAPVEKRSVPKPTTDKKQAPTLGTDDNEEMVA